MSDSEERDLARGGRWKISLRVLSGLTLAVGMAAALRIQDLTGRGWYSHVPPTISLAILTVLLLLGLFMMLNSRD